MVGYIVSIYKLGGMAARIILLRYVYISVQIAYQKICDSGINELKRAGRLIDNREEITCISHYSP